MPILRVSAALVALAAWALCLAVAPAAAQTAGRQGGAGRAGQQQQQPFRRPSVAERDEDVVERVFEKYFDALGSLRAMASVHSRIMRAYVTHSKSGLPGTMEYYAKAPNKSVTVLNVPGGAQFIEGFDGSAAWLQTPFAAAFVLEATPAVINREVEFRRKRAREMFTGLKYKGRGEVEGRAAEMVEAKSAVGPPQVLYFDVRTGLLARADVLFPPRNGEKGFTAVVFFDRYAEVDGLKLPVVFRLIYPSHTLTVKIHEVKHNVTLDDNLFDRPQPPKAKPGEK